MNTPNEKILDRLSKLLALAQNSGATENEAEVALAMAHKMMAKHNLSLLDIEQRSTGAGTPAGLRVGELRWTVPTSRKWAAIVLQAAALVHYCRVVQMGSGSRNYMIVGTAENCQASQMIAMHCIESMIKASKPYGHGSNSFLVGAALGLLGKANHILAQANGEAGSGKDLIVLQNTLQQRNQDYLNKLGGVREKSMQLSMHSATAHHAGRRFAESLNLQRGLNK